MVLGIELAKSTKWSASTPSTGVRGRRHPGADLSLSESQRLDLVTFSCFCFHSNFLALLP
jgi:hypothetical protein